MNGTHFPADLGNARNAPVATPRSKINFVEPSSRSWVNLLTRSRVISTRISQWRWLARGRRILIATDRTLTEIQNGRS